jgi:hypothetical protein
MSQETLWVESNLGIPVYRVMLVQGVDACADIGSYIPTQWYLYTTWNGNKNAKE